MHLIPSLQDLLSGLSHDAPLWPMRFADMALSVRAENALRNAGFECVQDLRGKTDQDLLGLRNLGLKSLYEIREELFLRGARGAATSPPLSHPPTVVREEACQEGRPLIVARVACPRRDIAHSLAQALLKAGLVACTHIQDCDSSFVWEGRESHVQEAILEMTTREELFPVIERVVNKLHPYQVPGLHAVRLHTLSAAYRQWIEQATQRAADEAGSFQP